MKPETKRQSRTDRTIVHAIILCVLACGSAAMADEPIIQLWYGDRQAFGVPGTSQQWINVLGNVSDAEGIASLSYSLNNGPQIPLTLGPDSRRLVSAGDFNIEIDHQNLVVGHNQVTITAVDSLGNTRVDSVAVEYTGGNAWPEPYAIDWQSVDNIQEVAQIVDGLWQIESAGVRPRILGYDRIIAVGDWAWTNYEVTVPITVHGIDTAGFAWPSQHPGFGVALRWRGHTDVDGSQPRWGYTPIGGTAWYSFQSPNNLGNVKMTLGDENAATVDSSGRVLAFEVPYFFKLRVEETAGGQSWYRFKTWQAGEAEPGDWQLRYTEAANDLFAGSLLLIAHHVDVTFGNLTVAPLRDRYQQPGIIGSDDFAATELNTDLWTYVNPRNDVTLAMSGSHLSLALPLADGHDVWGSNTIPFKNTVPRIMQNANDVNFEIEIKFDSGVDTTFQQQGLLVEQDSTNLLRFEFICSYGGNTNVFAGSIADGIGSSRFHREIGAPGLNPLYLRVKRQGNRWTMYYSFDGIDWLLAGAFSHYLAVSKIGVHAGNSRGVAHTAVVDYFRTLMDIAPDTVAPVISNLHIGADETVAIMSWETDELACSHVAYGFSASHELGTAGSDLLQQAHQIVLADLLPDTIYHCQITVKDKQDNRRTTQDLMFRTAADTVAPLIIPGQIFANVTSATIRWETSEAAKYRIDYGRTASHELGSVSDDVYALDHQATISGLQPSTSYHYAVFAIDKGGNMTTTGDRVLTTANAPPNRRSDDFTAAGLDTALWYFVNPLDDAALTMTGSQIAITVPPTASHTIWGTAGGSYTYTVPRIMQQADNVDFEIELKFDSGVNANNQQQGIVIEQDSMNVLRLEFYNNNAETKIFAASFVEGAPTVRTNRVVGSAGALPLYMRVKRTGDHWTQMYSFDGADWTTAVEFTHTLAVTAVGAYVGNTRDVAHTGLVDYFYYTDDSLLSITSGDGTLPTAYQLYSNFPNPFNPTTTLAVDVPFANASSAPVQLYIYNDLGQVVRRLFDDRLPAGRHRLLWDGYNDSGTRAVSGVYYAVMRASDYRGTIKMTLIK